jgi:hypothetical protein
MNTRKITIRGKNQFGKKAQETLKLVDGNPKTTKKRFAQFEILMPESDSVCRVTLKRY